MAGTASADLLVGWEFTGLSGVTAGSVTANVAGVNMAVPGDMLASRGDGLVAASNTGGYSANNWHSHAPSLATAMSSNNYYQFTVEAAVGYTVTTTNMVWNMRRSGTGPTNFVLRASVDGYASDLATWDTGTDTSSGGLTATLNLAAQSDVTFRLYGFSGTSSVGSMNLGGAGNDVEFYGTTQVIPEPGTLALISIGLAAAAFVRRRKFIA